MIRLPWSTSTLTLTQQNTNLILNSLMALPSVVRSKTDFWTTARFFKLESEGEHESWPELKSDFFLSLFLQHWLRKGRHWMGPGSRLARGASRRMLAQVPQSSDDRDSQSNWTRRSSLLKLRHRLHWSVGLPGHRHTRNWGADNCSSPRNY